MKTNSVRTLWWRRRVATVFGFLLTSTLVVVALWPTLTFLRIAFERIGYPYELEWMEGGIVAHVRTLMAGQPLYVKPSFDFTPFIYPPLYYGVSALAASLFGVHYVVFRLVSLLSTLACMAQIGHWVRKETGDVTAGLIAVGTFSAAYSVTGYWFDIVREDTLFLALLLAGYLVARFQRTPRAAAFAGLLLACSALTKQVGLPLSLPALGYLLLVSPRLGLVAGGVFSVVLALVFGGLHATSHGWSTFYIFTVPSHHAVAWNNWLVILRTFVWAPAPLLTASALGVVFGLGFSREAWREWLLHAAFTLTAVITSLGAILHTGGYPNTLMPAFAAFACDFALLLSALRRGDPRFALPYGAQLATLAVLVFQFQLLTYDANAPLPKETDRIAGAAFIKQLARLPQPVWVSSSNEYPVLAGQKHIFAHPLGPVDVFKAGGPVAATLNSELVGVIRSHRFKTIVLHHAAGFLPPNVVDEIHQNYKMTSRLFPDGSHDFYPLTGAEIRPDEVWEVQGP